MQKGSVTQIDVGLQRLLATKVVSRRNVLRALREVFGPDLNDSIVQQLTARLKKPAARIPKRH